MKGKNTYKRTEETKRKISIANARRKSTFESRQKTRISMLKKWQEPEYRKSVLRKRGMSSLETKMQTIIDKNSLPYRFVGDGKFFIETKCPDFVNTNNKKIVIETYCKRHKDAYAGGFDKWRAQREQLFSKHGWKTLFFNPVDLNDEHYIIELCNE